MRVLLFFFMGLFLVGCNNTTIYPEGGNRYSSVSTSSAQGHAELKAKKDAETYCQKMGKQFILLQHNHEYHGADSNTKIWGGVAGALLGTPNYAITEHDHEVKLNFKCV